MDYAYIYYPEKIKNLADQLPLLKYLPEYLAEKARPYYSPVLSSLIIDSVRAEGGAIACPWPDKRRVKESVQKAVKHGVKAIGIEPELFKNSALKHLDLKDIEAPVFLGKIAALYAALEVIRMVIESKGLSYNKAHFIVIGSHLPLCRMIVQILARKAKYITLVGYSNMETEKLYSQVIYDTGLALKFSQLHKKAIKSSEIVVTVSWEDFISIDYLTPGTILCDLTDEQIKPRDDIITIQNPDYKIPLKYEGLKSKPLLLDSASAPLIEIIIANLENEYELFSHQREMTINQVDKVFGLIKKHGFSVEFPAKQRFVKSPKP